MDKHRFEIPWTEGGVPHCWCFRGAYKNPVIHAHHWYECLFIIKGHVNLIAEPDVIELREPCIILHRPYSFHSIDSFDDEEYVRYTFYFTPKHGIFTSDYYPNLDSLFSGNTVILPIDKESLVRWVALFAAFTSIEDASACELFCVAILRECMKLTPLELPGKRRASQSYITDVMEYISEHFTEPLSIDSIAEQFFVSRSKLTSDFRAVTSITVHNFLLKLRLEYSCELLRSGMNVTSAAMGAGFASYTSFIRTFSNHYGISPRKYVNRL